MSRPLLRSDERGSTVVEFALVSPVLIMLILAALQFGMVLRANSGLRDLAGWAGREAVVSYQLVSDGTIGATQLKNNIVERAENARYNLRDGTLNVTVTSTADTTLLTVNRVRIRMTYNQPISLPFLPITNIPLRVDRTFFVPNDSNL